MTLARQAREQPVEAAIDGYVGDDRDQHRAGTYGDNGEQADDLDMQPGRRPAASPRLNHQPDLADDDATSNRMVAALISRNE